MKYRKKPIVVEAFQWFEDTELPDWAQDKCVVLSYRDLLTLDDMVTFLKIETLEGTMKANVGDYIIKGIKGEVYPCKPDIFEQTYEKVDNTIVKECEPIGLIPKE